MKTDSYILGCHFVIRAFWSLTSNGPRITKAIVDHSGHSADDPDEFKQRIARAPRGTRKDATKAQKVCYHENADKLLTCLDLMVQKLSTEDVEAIVEESVSIMEARTNNLLNALANIGLVEHHQMIGMESIGIENSLGMDHTVGMDLSTSSSGMNQISMELPDDASVGGKRKRSPKV